MSEGLGMADLDEARLEWEFEALQRVHRYCCAGAVLVEFEDESRGWMAVIVLSAGMTVRPWDPPEP